MKLLVVTAATCCLVQFGCAGLVRPAEEELTRRAGQVELLYIDTEEGDLLDSVPLEPRKSIIGAQGDPIRYNDDIVTLQVHTAYFQSLADNRTFIDELLTADPPNTRDLVLFAEVWENAAAGYNSDSLNVIVALTKNQIIPGRMNFTGNIAYGPTTFKGHPLRVKFTLVVLNRGRNLAAGSAADVLENIASATSPIAVSTGGFMGAFSSEAVGIIRQLLQSQPDVEAFDFDITFLSDEPEALAQTILGKSARPPEKQVATAPSKDPKQDEPVDSMGSEEYAGLDLSLRTFPGALNVDALITRAELIGPMPWPHKDVTFEQFDAARSSAVTSAGAVSRIDDGILDRAWDMVSAGEENTDDFVALSETTRTIHFDRMVFSRSIWAAEQYGDVLARLDLDEEPSLEDHLERLWEACATLEAVVLQKSHVESKDLVEPHWMRYGYYVLVETRPAEASTRRNEQHPMKLTGDWYKHFEFRDGWIVVKDDMEREYADRSELVEEGTGRLKASYLVFSVTPAQLPQELSVLRNASRAADSVLATVLQGVGEGQDGDRLRAEIEHFGGSVWEGVLWSKWEGRARTLIRYYENLFGDPALVRVAFSRDWKQERERVKERLLERTDESNQNETDGDDAKRGSEESKKEEGDTVQEAEEIVDLRAEIEDALEAEREGRPEFEFLFGINELAIMDEIFARWDARLRRISVERRRGRSGQ